MLWLYGIEISRFYVTDHRNDSYFTIGKTIGSAQVVVEPVVDALLMFVGAQRAIVGAHLSIVGARAPTKSCELMQIDTDVYYRHREIIIGSTDVIFYS